MKNLFIFLIIALFFSACSLKIVKNHHGVHFLKKKNDKLIVNKSNKNDILDLLGSPSTKSTFDNDVWIYMERKFTSSELKTLGKEKLLVNNVLVLEFDNKGLLVKKNLLSIDEMNNINISTDETLVLNKKKNFVNTFLTSIIKKINDPLGIKKAK